VGDRMADAAGRGVGADRVDHRPHRGLGRAVHVPQLADARQQLRGQIRRQRFAADQRLELRAAAPIGFQQQAPGRRRGLQHGRAAGFDQVFEAGAVHGLLALGQDHARAADQRQPQFQRSDVEAQRSHREQAVAAVQAGTLGHAGEEIRQRAVLDHHALGQAGGAGGVDEVGQLRGARLRGFGPGRIGHGRLAGLIAIDLQHRQRGLERQPLAHRARGQQRLGRAVLQHVGQTLGRIRRIQR
ncbi:hypothetical protein CATMIT_01572, partial [Catenibacterium mitsuokai DSM 15897]